MIFPELRRLLDALIAEYIRTRRLPRELNLKIGYDNLWNFFAMPLWVLIESTIPSNLHADSDHPQLRQLTLTCEVWPERPEFVLAADTSAGDFEFRFQSIDVRNLTQLQMHRDFDRWFRYADAMIAAGQIFGNLLAASSQRCPQAMRPLGVDWLSVSYRPDGALSRCDLRTSSLAREEAPISEFHPFLVSNYRCSIMALASLPDLFSYTLHGWFHFGGREMSLVAELTEQGADTVEAELAPVVVQREGRRRPTGLVTEPMATPQLIAGIESMGLGGPASLLGGLPFNWNIVTGVIERSTRTATVSASTPECWKAIGSAVGQFTSGARYQIGGATVSDVELTFVASGGNYWRLNLQGIFWLDAKPWPSWFELDLGQLDDYPLSRVCFGRRYFVREGLDSAGGWISQLPMLYQDTIPAYTGENHFNVLYLPEQRGGAFFEEFFELLSRKGA